MWCLIFLTLLYFFSGTIFVGVQQELSDAIQCLYQHTSRYGLNQKHVQLKFNLPSCQWMGICMKAMVKLTKRLKEIVQIMYLHWVGSVLTVKRIVSGNLCLIKVTSMEKLSSNSLLETLGTSQFSALRLLRLNLLESKMVLLIVVLREAWECLLL